MSAPPQRPYVAGPASAGNWRSMLQLRRSSLPTLPKPIRQGGFCRVPIHGSPLSTLPSWSTAAYRFDLAAGVHKPRTRGPVASITAGVAVAVDSTTNAEQALEWVLKAVCSEGDKLFLVHVCTDERATSEVVGRSATGRLLTVASVDDDWNIPKRKVYLGRLKEEGLEDMHERFVEPYLKDRDHEVLVEVQQGAKNAASIGEILCQEAEKAGARMLVIASHGTGLLADFGSVARYCIQNFKGTLLLVPPDVLSMPSPNKGMLLAAINDDDELLSILDRGVAGVSRAGDSLHVMKVGQQPGSPSADSLPSEQARKLQEQGIVDVERTEIVLENGDSEGIKAAATKVTSKAEELEARVTLMVNYAQAGMMQEMMFGSLASFCSRLSKRPLLLVPHQSTGFPGGAP